MLSTTLKCKVKNAFKDSKQTKVVVSISTESKQLIQNNKPNTDTKKMLFTSKPSNLAVSSPTNSKKRIKHNKTKKETQKMLLTSPKNKQAKEAKDIKQKNMVELTPTKSMKRIENMNATENSTFANTKAPPTTSHFPVMFSPHENSPQLKEYISKQFESIPTLVRRSPRLRQQHQPVDALNRMIFEDLEKASKICQALKSQLEMYAMGKGNKKHVLSAAKYFFGVEVDLKECQNNIWVGVGFQPILAYVGLYKLVDDQTEISWAFSKVYAQTLDDESTPGYRVLYIMASCYWSLAELAMERKRKRQPHCATTSRHAWETAKSVIVPSFSKMTTRAQLIRHMCQLIERDMLIHNLLIVLPKVEPWDQVLPYFKERPAMNTEVTESYFKKLIRKYELNGIKSLPTKFGNLLEIAYKKGDDDIMARKSIDWIKGDHVQEIAELRRLCVLNYNDRCLISLPLEDEQDATTITSVFSDDKSHHQMDSDSEQYAEGQGLRDDEETKISIESLEENHKQRVEEDNDLYDPDLEDEDEIEEKAAISNIQYIVNECEAGYDQEKKEGDQLLAEYEAELHEDDLSSVMSDGGEVFVSSEKVTHVPEVKHKIGTTHAVTKRFDMYEDVEEYTTGITNKLEKVNSTGEKKRKNMSSEETELIGTPEEKKHSAVSTGSEDVFATAPMQHSDENKRIVPAPVRKLSFTVETESDEKTQNKWEEALKNGPNHILQNHARLKGLKHAKDGDFIFICRCPSCLKGDPMGARVSCLPRQQYVPAPISDPTFTFPDDAIKKNIVYIDNHGFISYHHPWPTNGNCVKQRSDLRTHIANANGYDHENELPLVARVSDERKTKRFWNNIKNRTSLGTKKGIPKAILFEASKGQFFQGRIKPFVTFSVLNEEEFKETIQETIVKKRLDAFLNFSTQSSIQWEQHTHTPVNTVVECCEAASRNLKETFQCINFVQQEDDLHYFMCKCLKRIPGSLEDAIRFRSLVLVAYVQWNNMKHLCAEQSSNKLFAIEELMSLKACAKHSIDNEKTREEPCDSLLTVYDNAISKDIIQEVEHIHQLLMPTGEAILRKLLLATSSKIYKWDLYTSHQSD